MVVGFGAAGATAAITAHDAGCRVVILEKMSAGGGNTAVSAGTVLCPDGFSDAVEHILALSFDAVNRDMVETYVREASDNIRWLRSLGAEVEPRGGASFPEFKGASAMKTYALQGKGSGGERLWSFLRSKVDERGIEALLETAVRELIQEGGEIVGVKAEDKNGPLRVRARHAVVLTCGGFEYAEDLKKEYLPGPVFFSFGNPGNTGDGVRMAQKVGAALWHMSAVAAPFGHKFPELDAAFSANLARQSNSDPFAYAFIYVDKYGRRFMDELSVDNHFAWSALSYFDTKKLEYPRVPSYMIFDETVRRAGPLVRNHVGYNRFKYQWSEDNSKEISKGWVASGATIDELAQVIEVDQENLSRSVADYNNGCGLKKDSFGRPVRSLMPISNPPYYAVKTYPSLLNTQGGPMRNAKAQVLDSFGKPIPRLYSAGELGSLWGFLYQGSGNLGECLAFGRIAGRNASAEKPV